MISEKVKADTVAAHRRRGKVFPLAASAPRLTGGVKWEPRRPACKSLVARCLVMMTLTFLAHPSAGVTDATPAADSPVVVKASSVPPQAVFAKPALDLAQIERNATFWPKEVTLLNPVPFDVVFEGRVAGQMVVPAGARLQLIHVSSDRGELELENDGVCQWVRVGSTDLIERATRLRDAELTGPAPPGSGLSASPAAAQESIVDYRARAEEVTGEIQRDFWNPQTGWYAGKPGEKHPALDWPAGVMFSALAAAARNDPERYRPVMRKFFDALNAYWDGKQPLGGYEPLPQNGNGGDKYYDDNEWLAIAFLEAYAVTGENIYAKRAAETVKFVLSGWDETYLGGGIWWHESREKKVRAKNTCANAPAAVACLRLARISQPAEARDLLAMAQKITNWTVANLQLPNGLFADAKNIDGTGLNKLSFTYNSALMIRAFLGLYQANGQPADLQKAQRIALAADSLLDKNTGIYRDNIRWAHLMVEADLALYRTTKEPYLLRRARRNADAYYELWKAGPPGDLITVASVARVLWLMADMQTASGGDFWKKEELPGANSLPSGSR